MYFKAVGFDLDDTLYDRNQIYKKVFQNMEDRVVRTNLEFDTFNDEYQYNSILEYEKYMDGRKSKSLYKIDRVRNTYKAFKHKIGFQNSEFFNDLYQHYLGSDIKLQTGVEDLLDILVDRNIDIFLFTNGTSDGQRKKIEKLNLTNYFSEGRIFISEELGESKPNTQAFKSIEEQINYNPSDIIYIGDNWKSDILGATDAGWRAIYLNDQHHENLKSDRRITVCKDFEDIYNELFQTVQ